MFENYDEDSKSQWEAYFKMKGENKNPPTGSFLYDIRKNLLNSNNLTPSKADFHDMMVILCFNLINMDELDD